jgi:predicted GNAT superfamily acetyltransferase
MAIVVRDATPDDEAFILAANASGIPGVAEMDADDYRETASACWRVRIAEAGGRPAGFIMLIRPRAPYPSLNYAWFEQRFASHLYIDRIAVDGWARGQGVGRALYEDAMAVARDCGEARLTAEVNDDPPNPESHAFHKALGFVHLLSRPWKDKVVSMYERPL